jgi:CRP/FNR family transcriptional regulator, anaerobic regulatory protein
MNQELFAFLNQMYPLSGEIKTRLTSILKCRKFKKKTYLLKEGQFCKHIYFIEKGLVRIYYLKDGVELCSGLLCEGGVVISVNSFFNREASYEYIQAIEDTTVHFISYDELDSLYKDFLEFNVIGRLLTQRYYILSEGRNYLLRKQKANEKFAYFQKELGHLASRVPRKDIASYLGINLETLSRLGY